MDAKSPPRVETEVSRTSFPIRQVMQPHDGFFMHYLTCRPYLGLPGLGPFYSVVAPLYHQFCQHFKKRFRIQKVLAGAVYERKIVSKFWNKSPVNTPPSRAEAEPTLKARLFFCGLFCPSNTRDYFRLSRRKRHTSHTRGGCYCFGWPFWVVFGICRPS